MVNLKYKIMIKLSSFLLIFSTFLSVPISIFAESSEKNVNELEYPTKLERLQELEENVLESNNYSQEEMNLDEEIFEPLEEKDEVEPEIVIEDEKYDISEMNLEEREIGIAPKNGATGNDQFEFEAFIRNNEVTDGTAPFDRNDNEGYDSRKNNGIVRTFDSVTYPLKVTVNPKKSGTLRNIRLKITGEIVNGISNNRVNAVFAYGSKVDREKSKVTFEQFYTINESSSSVMVPVVVEAKGAVNNTSITPKIKVEVVSVDGVPLKSGSVVANFNQLNPVKISGKVSLGIKASGVFGADSISEKAVNKHLKDDSVSIVHQFSMGVFAKPLPGKSNMIGTTFPEGQLNYYIDVSGRVEWDNGRSETLDFINKNEPVELFSVYPISEQQQFEGTKNTISEKFEPYNWRYAHTDGLSRSFIPDSGNQESVDTWSDSSVWDSGTYDVDKAVVQRNMVRINGSSRGFFVGSTFPTVRADNSTIRAFNENEYAFSTQAFLLRSPNEYFPFAKLNKDNKANNVYYTMKVVLASYTDKSGKKVPINASSSITRTERNNPKGAYTLQGTFYSSPDGLNLGTPFPPNPAASKGDATIVKGEDVTVLHYLYSGMVNLGGFKYLFKWNPDSFGMSKENSEDTLFYYARGYLDNTGNRVPNSPKHKVYFGVSKSKDNSFKAITERNHGDYTWYDTYEKAVAKGEISATLQDIKDEVGVGTVSNNWTYLTVKTDKIGSFNEKGTPNIFAQQGYMYPLNDRKQEFVARATGYRNPTEYNSAGRMTKQQSPVGPTINFDTLGIVNAELSTSIDSDRNTYYTTEIPKFTVKSGLNVPSRADFSRGIEIKLRQVLPKGLFYSLDTAKVGTKYEEPEIIKKSDGTTELVWSIMLSNKERKIPDITYSTHIDPLELPSTMEASLTVKSIIESGLDTRPEEFRTGSKRIKIVKIGQVGVRERIDFDNGERNSSFTVRMSPYTTIENEYEVKGKTIIPLSNDTAGSNYSGSAYLSDIQITGNKPVSVYLNDSVVDSKHPQKIDLESGGWYKYVEGGNQDISKALSLIFHVEGVMTNKDRNEVALTIQTKDNKFRDVYYKNTILNSDTNYGLSPISNNVRYTIRADAEVELESLRIHTAKSDAGLPVSLRLSKEMFQSDSKNEPIKLALYEKATNIKVYEKSYRIGTLPDEFNFKIPSQYLEKDTNKSYEARFEGYDTKRIDIKEGADRIDTLGYTASEKLLKKQAVDNTSIDYKGVIMTERAIGKKMSVYYETLNIPLDEFVPIKSGYGFSLNQRINYENELEIKELPKMKLIGDSKSVDGDFYSEKDGKKTIDLLGDTRYADKKVTTTYTFPEIFVSQGEGEILPDKQYHARRLESSDVILSGGNKIYVPIWIEELGKYNFSFQNVSPIGVNAINIEANNKLDVYAFMYAHIGSKTIEQDELLVAPIYPDSDNPIEATEKDIEWIRGLD